MFEDYEELYAAYDYAKTLENGTYNELNQRLEKYNKLIIERDAQHEKSADKHLFISWSITTALLLVLFVALFPPEDILGFFASLLVSSLISAFLIFVFIAGLYNWIYLKNLQEAHELEVLKFHWLVIKKELERRISKEAEQILVELDNEVIAEE